MPNSGSNKKSPFVDKKDKNESDVGEQKDLNTVDIKGGRKKNNNEIENEIRMTLQEKIKIRFCDDEPKEQFSLGIEPSKLVYMYFKKTYGIQKVNLKDKRPLIEIWENKDGIDKDKYLVVDALTHDNLNKILMILNENNSITFQKGDDL